MSWRDIYKVHPAADVFPMLSDAELAELGEDIKKNGQTIPVLLWRSAKIEPVLIDGRNRLEAMERVGIDPGDVLIETFTCKDPVTHIISLNIRRRHLTKQQQADLIVAAIKAAEDKPRQDGEVSGKVWIKSACGTPLWETPFDTIEECEAAFEARAREDRARARKGGRGRKNKIKEKAVAAGAEHGISARTVERSIAKAEGKTPKPKGVVGDENWKALVKEGKEVVARLHKPKTDADRVREHAIYLDDAWSAAHKDARTKFLIHIFAKEIGPTTEAAREFYATQLAEMSMADIATEIDMLKASVGERKGITAPTSKPLKENKQ